MSFEKWVEDYALRYEPNYSVGTEQDCHAAYNAGYADAKADGLVGVEIVECCVCAGSGNDPEMGVEAVCCRRPSINGECCGSPEPFRVSSPCRQCKGSGSVYITSPAEEPDK